MAKYDPDRITETAEPYAPGTSGIEPLCDEFGRMVLAPGGGGGGDATAANQLTTISRLDTLITDLGTRVSEVTGQNILTATQEVRDAVTNLGDGATLGDLFTRLGDIDSRLTADALVQSDIASDTQLSRLALQAIEPDVEEIRSDADATRIACESIRDRSPRAPSSRTATGAPTPAQSGEITTVPGSLLSFRGLKTTAGTEYLQFHDATSLAAISNATMVGFGYALVGANSEILLDFRNAPLAFSNRIIWALSTAQLTYTAAAGDLAAVFAQWE